MTFLIAPRRTNVTAGFRSFESVVIGDGDINGRTEASIAFVESPRRRQDAPP